MPASSHRCLITYTTLTSAGANWFFVIQFGFLQALSIRSHCCNSGFRKCQLIPGHRYSSGFWKRQLILGHSYNSGFCKRPSVFKFLQASVNPWSQLQCWLLQVSVKTHAHSYNSRRVQASVKSWSQSQIVGFLQVSANCW